MFVDTVTLERDRLHDSDPHRGTRLEAFVFDEEELVGPCIVSDKRFFVIWSKSA